MARYELILFDLDGTLTDSKVGVTRSVQYALARFGLDEPAEKLVPFVGPPLIDSFKRFYRFDDAQARQAVEYYREYYGERGIFENDLYPGIAALLGLLHGRGRTLVVATSKPTFYAEQILSRFALRRFFTLVAGSNLDGSRVLKAEIIRDILLDFPGRPRDRTVMIGDHRFDVEGAHQNGIDSIAVAYGYGLLEELQGAVPTHLVHTVTELQQILA
jgi:phosphoglycolate phosphatase